MGNQLKNLFISYIKSHGGDAEIMEMGPDIILSFAGSDGPTITELGLEEEGEIILFSDTQKIDEYLVDGCSDNFSVFYDHHIPVLPTKSWKEYYEKERSKSR